MKYNAPESTPTIIDLFGRQEPVPGIDLPTLVLANEAPGVVSCAVENAFIAKGKPRPGQETDQSTGSIPDIIGGAMLPQEPISDVEYATILSDSILAKRKGAERFLFRVGVGVGTAATLVTFWTTFGGWLSTPSSESSEVSLPSTSPAPSDSRSAPQYSAEADEQLKRYVEITGNLGAVIVGLAIGSTTSTQGAGYLARGRARKEVANARAKAPEV